MTILSSLLFHLIISSYFSHHSLTKLVCRSRSPVVGSKELIDDLQIGKAILVKAKEEIRIEAKMYFFIILKTLQIFASALKAYVLGIAVELGVAESSLAEESVEIVEFMTSTTITLKNKDKKYVIFSYRRFLGNCFLPMLNGTKSYSRPTHRRLAY